MILADDEAGRRRAAQDRPVPEVDFVELFTIMAGLLVTVRLLDPPLHEFILHEVDIDVASCRELGPDAEKLKRRAKGIRTRPTDARASQPPRRPIPRSVEMQVRAIIESPLQVKKTAAECLTLEIMNCWSPGLEMKYLR
jgi:pyruvate,orthophosphate dikinase